jgi:hypothetical protein
MPSPETPASGPLTVTIAGAVARTGISRTSLFHLAGLRQIRMVKSAPEPDRLGFNEGSRRKPPRS